MLDSKTIKKYEKKTIPALIKIATKHFNEFIRNRDEGKPCISSGKLTKLQAGHYFSAGKYPRTRFNEDNVHGQSLQENYYGSMETGVNYRKNLINRIGLERVEKVERIAEDPTPFKWDRFSLIEIIEEYKKKKKLV